MNFKEMYLAGEVELEDIDLFSQRWGRSDDIRTLREYLGLNEEEEDVWISIGDDALFDLLEKEKTNQTK